MTKSPLISKGLKSWSLKYCCGPSVVLTLFLPKLRNMFLSVSFLITKNVSDFSWAPTFSMAWHRCKDSSCFHFPGFPLLGHVYRDDTQGLIGMTVSSGLLSASELLILPLPTRCTFNEFMGRLVDTSVWKYCSIFSDIQSSLPHLSCILLMIQQ